MRLKMLLETRRTALIPLNHNDLLRGLVYRLLGQSDDNYARRVHDDGWAESSGNDSAGTARPVKLFTFSTLRVPQSRRRIEGRDLVIAPGIAEWWLSSPVEDFLRHEVQGLLSSGGTLRVGEATFTLVGAEASAPPAFFAPGADGLTRARFSCLTPLVASIPSPEGRATPYYLRPRDGIAFSDALGKNLVRKYALAYGSPPADDRFTLTFDADYLDRDRHGGTKKITLRDTDIVGAFVPFTLTTTPDLLRAAWELGLGQHTGSGFGMIEVAR